MDFIDLYRKFHFFKILAFAIGTVIMAIALRPERTEDMDWEQDLIGTWQYHEAKPKGAIIDGQMTFLPDGKMSVAGSVKGPGNERAFVGAGTWKLDHKYLGYVLHESTPPGIVFSDIASPGEISSLTKEHCNYVDAGSQPRTLTRLK